VVDLRTAAAQLIENPVVPTPPIEGVVARARAYRAARLRRQMGAGAIVLALAVTAVVRAGIGGGGPDSLRMVGDPASNDSGGVHVEYPSTTSVPHPGYPERWQQHDWRREWDRLRSTWHADDCPLELDRALPTIKVLANDVKPPTPDEEPLFAVAQKHFDALNLAGGVCGHALELVKGTVQELGHRKDLVAVLGMPLDREMDDAIRDGLLDRVGLPLVGGDGLSEVQHQAHFVYPVGTSASALARTAVADARERGARNFSIVYDSTQTFGREAAEAFSRYVPERMIKATIDIGLPGAGLATGSQRFQQVCGNRSCDFVFLALPPDTGDQWLQTRPAGARVETAALPTLLTGGMVESCFRTSNDRCNGLVSWTGFAPDIKRVETRWPLEKVELSATHGSAMSAAAELGADVLHNALQKLGPTVNRWTLRVALETGAYFADASQPQTHLRWGRKLPRVGNPVARPWQLEVDDVVRWGAKVKAAYQASGTDFAEAIQAWADGVADAARGVPTWAEGAAAYGADAEAVAAEWGSDLGRWAHGVATEDWVGGARQWADDEILQGGEDEEGRLHRLPSRYPRYPHSPPPPRTPSAPPVSAGPLPPDLQPPPMPEKWWHETGSGFRGDPGE
jgi:ABC-type branched-subunit amino acid transport system substrate-binding protein